MFNPAEISEGLFRILKCEENMSLIFKNYLNAN